MTQLWLDWLPWDRLPGTCWKQPGPQHKKTFVDFKKCRATEHCRATEKNRVSQQYFGTHLQNLSSTFLKLKKTQPPKSTAGPFLQLHSWEHPYILHYSLVWQLHITRLKSPKAGNQNCTIHNWHQATGHWRPEQHALSGATVCSPSCLLEGVIDSSKHTPTDSETTSLPELSPS